MHQYIAETAHAVRGMFSLVGTEEATLESKRAALNDAIACQRSARRILHAGPPPTAFGEDSTPHFESKVRDARRKAEAVTLDIAALQAAVIAKETSTQALTGAILQIAKQGISIVHGGIDPCPAGRAIGSAETLKNVIWQARNQSMHWEENKFHPPVLSCFKNLAQDFGSEFQLPATTARPLAKQVLRILSWADYDSYERDMTSLLG